MVADFLKSFPKLANVLIESWEEGRDVGNPYTSTLPPKEYGPPRSIAGRTIPCANRSCRRGGFNILQEISEMVYEGLTTKEFVKDCPGDEGTPKRRGRDCLNTLHYRLILKYRVHKSGGEATDAGCAGNS